MRSRVFALSFGRQIRVELESVKSVGSWHRLWFLIASTQRIILLLALAAELVQSLQDVSSTGVRHLLAERKPKRKVPIGSGTAHRNL